MLKNNFYAFVLLLSLAPTASFAQNNEPCNKTTNCQKNFSPAHSQNKIILIELEITKKDYESSKEIQEAIQKLTETAKVKTNAPVIIPLLRDIFTIGVQQKLKSKLHFFPLAGSMASDVFNFINKKKFINSEIIKIRYIIKIEAKDYHLADEVNNLYISIFKTFAEKETLGEQELKNVIYKIFTTLAEPSDNLKGILC